MAPKRVDPAERRDHILAAAVRTFARKGYAASRIEDVAAEAGIAKGGVYTYYPSRESLLSAALEQYETELEAALEAARAPTAPPLDRLAALLRGVLRSAASHPDLARVFLDLWSTGTRDASQPLGMAEGFARYRAVVADLLREAATDGGARPGVGTAEAAAAVGAVEGVLLQWVIDPRLSLEELTDPVVRVVLDGVRSHDRKDR